jgi:hypothetical protein
MVLTILAALVGRDALRKLGGVVREALRSRAQLVAENALLRQQLLVLHRQVSRPRLTEADRWWMVAATRIIKRWEQARIIGKPATLLRWHRDMYYRWWTRKSKAARKASTTLAVDTIALIRESAPG